MSNIRLQSISKQRRKKYGANAPQLRPIRCSIDFYVMLCNEQAKKQKIRRKRATVAPYLLCTRLGSHPPTGERRKKQKKYGANAPQLHHIVAAVGV